MNNYNITDDLGAEKALLDLRKSKEETDRLIETCDSIIREYTEKKEQLLEKYQDKLQQVSFMLEGYMQTCDTKETKSQYSYKLPSAKLIKKKSNPKMVAKENLINVVPQEFIQTSLKLKWGEYKETLEIKNGVVCDKDTGEIIEDVEIEETAEKFEIKYT